MSIQNFAAICALLLTGCAANPKGDSSNDSQVASAEAVEATKTQRICKREKPLGSNLPRVTCYTRQQLDARNQSLDSVLRREGVRHTQPGPRPNLPGFRRDG